jgi:hypothetical protein
LLGELAGVSVWVLLLLLLLAPLLAVGCTLQQLHDSQLQISQLLLRRASWRQGSLCAQQHICVRSSGDALLMHFHLLLRLVCPKGASVCSRGSLQAADNARLCAGQLLQVLLGLPQHLRLLLLRLADAALHVKQCCLCCRVHLLFEPGHGRPAAPQRLQPCCQSSRVSSIRPAQHSAARHSTGRG